MLIRQAAHTRARDRQCRERKLLEMEQLLRSHAGGAYIELPEAMHALQHRGQEAAGSVTFDNDQFRAERHLGLVGDHFSDTETMARLPGMSAIGHVRYSTTGETILRNVQPLYADLASGGFAVAHNGNISNARTLRDDLVSRGAIFQSTSDTEVIIHLVATSRYPTMIDRLVDALRMADRMAQS